VCGRRGASALGAKVLASSANGRPPGRPPVSPRFIAGIRYTTEWFWMEGLLEGFLGAGATSSAWPGKWHVEGDLSLIYNCLRAEPARVGSYSGSDRTAAW